MKEKIGLGGLCIFIILSSATLTAAIITVDEGLFHFFVAWENFIFIVILFVSIIFDL